MLGRVIKFVILIAAVGVIWWWLDDSDQGAVVEVEEVSYEEVVKLESDEVVEEQGNQEGSQDDVEEPVEEVTPVADIPSSDGSSIGDVPASFNLAVPFTPQAPQAIWDLPYQEACEEASAYMVWMYYQGEPSGLIDADVAEAAILDLVDFQNDLFGNYLDTTAEQTREFMDLFYNLTVTVVDNPTIEQIKSEIAIGRPVIVPAAGQELGNPYFSGAGPLYHMFVIKGYTEDQFIVNDPGTYRGQDFVYDIDVIMDAMGDWNGGDPANGAKRVLFIAP